MLAPFISNIGHNELWQSLAANSLSVTLKMLWPLSTTKFRCYWLQMVNVLSQFDHKIVNLITIKAPELSNTMKEIFMQLMIFCMD